MQIYEQEQNEEELMFRAYQRGLLRSLKMVKDLLQNNEISAAKQVIDNLIADTEKDISEK